MRKASFYGSLLFLALYAFLSMWLPFLATLLIAAIAGACAYWVADDEPQWTEDKL